MKKQLDLIKILEDLLRTNDETWGLYAFSRDILTERISQKKKLEMINDSIECGKKYAEYIVKEFKSSDVNLIAEKLKLKIQWNKDIINENYILFASYTPKNNITIMNKPVENIMNLIKNEKDIFNEYFKKDIIINIILGHEIFHHIEELFKTKIYTKTEKVLLWQCLGFKNLSTIRAISEIGAMSFTKELNKIKYCPFILDVLLYYSYDSLLGEKIYSEILKLN